MKGRTSIAGAVVGSLIKSILFAAIVIAIAIALMRVSPLVGSMALLLFSGIMLVRANRKDIPLNVFTALLPGGVALLSYILQLAIAGVTDLAWPLLGVLAGMLPGWLVGRSHRIYVKDRQVFAHRTSGTILLWVIIYLIGQGATLLGLRQILPVQTKRMCTAPLSTVARSGLSNCASTRGLARLAGRLYSLQGPRAGQAPLAQSAERFHGKEKVNGSIPLGGSVDANPD